MYCLDYTIVWKLLIENGRVYETIAVKVDKFQNFNVFTKILNLNFVKIDYNFFFYVSVTHFNDLKGSSYFNEALLEIFCF